MKFRIATWTILYLFLAACLMTLSQARTPAPQNSESKDDPVPKPAISAILAAFDKYEVVGMPAAHGQKDLDDFILALIRNRDFPDRVNDIVVECGNSLYQPILDRYISGDDVPYKDVRKVWRNTTQPACGVNGFYEALFPLVRAINQKLPAGKRLRVLASDSPFDWDQIRTFADFQAALMSVRRDETISSVMEKEVLSKHRRALMLFGTFHLFHGASAGFQKDYPNATFVISELGTFDTNLPALSSSRFASWPAPSLALAKGTWLGSLDLAQFYPPPQMVDEECNFHVSFPKRFQRPVGELVDAFLYLGPQDLRLWEKTPADIVLDEDYMKEWRRRLFLTDSPGPSTDAQEFDQQILHRAENPIFAIEAKQPDAAEVKDAVNMCLERKRNSGKP
jgi:hypothetical protein